MVHLKKKKKHTTHAQNPTPKKHISLQYFSNDSFSTQEIILMKQNGGILFIYCTLHEQKLNLHK